MQILDIIKPIGLLKGTHEDTGATGQGCFMNVVAYLNGEPQITDQSTCVCVTVRPIAIWLNDFMRDDERAQLIPFIERAMGSATEDKTELVRRAWLAVDFANEARSIAAESAKYAAESAEYAAKSAKYAAEYAAKSAKSAAEAAESAKYAAKSAAEYAKYAKYAERRQALIAAGLRFLDVALPKAQPASAVVIGRASALMALS